MAFEILARLGLNASGFNSGLKRAESGAKAWSMRLNRAITGPLAQAFGAYAIIAGIKRTVDAASKIKDSADAVGLTVEKYQELKFAAEQSGTSMDAVSRAIGNIAKAQAQSGTDEKMAAAFQSLGISVDDLKSSSAVGLFDKIGRSLAGSATSTETLTAALMVFGKAGKEILPALYSDLGAMAERAHELGIILGTDTVEDLEALGDKWGEVQGQFQSGFAALTLAAKDFVGKFTDGIEAAFTGLFLAFENVRSGPRNKDDDLFKAVFGGFSEGFDAAVADQVDAAEKRKEERQRRRDAAAAIAEQVPGIATKDITAAGTSPQPQPYQANLSSLQRIGEEIKAPGTSSIDRQQLTQLEKMEKHLRDIKSSNGGNY